jgi:hypothetical protein
MEVIKENSFLVEPVRDQEGYALLCSVRNRVFQQEFGMKLAPIAFARPPEGLHLIGRLGPGGKAVAALTVLNTTGNDALHAGYGLCFPPGARVARYTQMAVLKKFRGRHLPLAMLLEANFRFTAPCGIDYTWMIIGAQQKDSTFCKLLGYTPGVRPIHGEMGISWAMVKNELLPNSGEITRECFTATEILASSVAEDDPLNANNLLMLPSAEQSHLCVMPLQYNEWTGQ